MAFQFTAIFEKAHRCAQDSDKKVNQAKTSLEEDDTYIGYCPEVPGANGQGDSIEECRKDLAEAVKLILLDRLEDSLKSIPGNAIREKLVIV